MVSRLTILEHFCYAAFGRRSLPGRAKSPAAALGRKRRIAGVLQNSLSPLPIFNGQRALVNYTKYQLPDCLARPYSHRLDSQLLRMVWLKRQAILPDFRFALV